MVAWIRERAVYHALGRLGSAIGMGARGRRESGLRTIRAGSPVLPAAGPQALLRHGDTGEEDSLVDIVKGVLRILVLGTEEREGGRGGKTALRCKE